VSNFKGPKKNLHGMALSQVQDQSSWCGAWLSTQATLPFTLPYLAENDYEFI
jgi:hypothetical protein